jgi:hypothetical protein
MGCGSRGDSIRTRIVTGPTLRDSDVLHRLMAVETGTASSSTLLVDPIVYRAYTLGYQKAQDACGPHHVRELEQRLARAEFDADTYYELWLYRAKDPSDRRRLTEMRRRRIDQALAEASDDVEPLTLERQLAVVLEAALPVKRSAA